MPLAERSLFNDWKGCGKEMHVYELVFFLKGALVP